MIQGLKDPQIEVRHNARVALKNLGVTEEEIKQLSSSNITNSDSSIRPQQAMHKYFKVIEQSIAKLDQASRQNNPQLALEVEKDLMKSAKTLVDELGTEADKQKANKAELVYNHYERYIDALDLSNPRPFAQVAAPVKEHLKIALFNALTSGDANLIAWGRDYALKVGMSQQDIDKIVHSEKNEQQNLNLNG